MHKMFFFQYRIDSIIETNKEYQSAEAKIILKYVIFVKVELHAVKHDFSIAPLSVSKFAKKIPSRCLERFAGPELCILYSCFRGQPIYIALAGFLRT